MALLTEREKHPELFIDDLNIDPRTRSRSVPMEILSLGMSRTGTASVQAALQILGYDPCYHGFTLYSRVRDCTMWNEGMIAKYFPNESSCSPFGRAEFDQLLGDHRACCDFPANVFGPELIAAYPDAKVILVERNIDAWYTSFKRVVIDQTFEPISNFIASLDPVLRPMSQMGRPWAEGFFRSKTKAEFEKNARAVYKSHYAEIRNLTPKERLLDFELKDGWEPLCAFLGKQVPNVPFPMVNEGEMASEKVAIVVKAAAWRLFSKVAGFLTVAGAIGLGVHLSKK